MHFYHVEMMQVDWNFKMQQNNNEQLVEEFNNKKVLVLYLHPPPPSSDFWNSSHLSGSGGRNLSILRTQVCALWGFVTFILEQASSNTISRWMQWQ